MRLLIAVLLLVACGDKSPDSAGPPAAKVETTVDAKKVDSRIAIALVINGWEMWIGNDKEVKQLDEADPSRYPGLLVDLRSAIDHVKLGEAGPPRSLGMVITYSDKPIIRVPMGPLGEITGAALGTQADYFGVTGVELVSGIRLALAELYKAKVSRRVLIVIGDGSDTNNDMAKSHLRQLAKDAARDNVETFAIIYKAKLSGEETVLTTMIPDAVSIKNASDVDAALATIVAKIKRK